VSFKKREGEWPGNGNASKEGIYFTSRLSGLTMCERNACHPRGLQGIPKKNEEGGRKCQGV
jgi:hypothetical protein